MLTPADQLQPGAATSSDALVGVLNPPTQVVLARPIAEPTDAVRLVEVLRQLWRHTFAGDTAEMVVTLIATDWQRLQPGIASAGRPGTAGRDVVAGVGVAAGTNVGQPKNLCLTEVGDLGADRLCLIDPVADSLTVHTGDGRSCTVYPLAG